MDRVIGAPRAVPGVDEKDATPALEDAESRRFAAFLGHAETQDIDVEGAGSCIVP